MSIPEVIINQYQPKTVCRDEGIDGLKGIAIIGVLFAHMNFLSCFNQSTIEVVHILHLVFGWCVLAFFFASGYLNKPQHSKNDFGKFVAKRFRRLIIPYYVFSFTYKILMIALFYAG